MTHQCFTLGIAQGARHIGIDEAGRYAVDGYVAVKPISRASDLEKPMMPALAAA